MNPANLHFTLTLSAFLAVVPARGNGLNFCAGMAFLAESEQPPLSLIEETYFGLLDKTASVPSPATLAKMKAGDLFKVPEQDGADFGLLRRNLADLKKMLEGKTWLTESVRKQLSVALESRMEGLVTADKKVTDATIQSGRTTIGLPDTNHTSLVDPSGRWIISVDHRLGAYVTGHVIDLETNAVTPFQSLAMLEGGDSIAGATAFSASKQDLLFTTFHGQGFSVPFKLGTLAWDQAKKRWAGPDSDPHADLEPNGWYAFNRKEVKHGAISRRDLTTFKQIAIEIPGIGIEAGTELAGYGQVPGSDRIWVSKVIFTKIPGDPPKVDRRIVVETYELKRKGIFSTTNIAVKPVTLMSKPWKGEGLKVNWTDQGKLITQGGAKIEKWVTPQTPEVLFDGKTQKLSFDPDAISHGGQIQGNFYVELLWEQHLKIKRWVRTVDLSTGKVLVEIVVPTGSLNPQLTPDGKTIVIDSPTGIHLVPHVPGR